MRNRIMAIVSFALILLASTTCSINASPAASEVSVESLTKNPEAFGGRVVRLQGYLASQQFLSKPTTYYLRDDGNSMIELKFQSEAFDGHRLTGKRVEIIGYSSIIDNKASIEVSDITALDAAQEEPQAEFGPIGELKTLVILSYFPDRTYTKSVTDVYSMIFNDMNNYWIETTYSMINLAGYVDIWRRVPNNIGGGYYGNPNGNSWRLINDAVAAADPDIDFSRYNYYVFMYAGPGEETSGNANDIWYVRWSGLNIATNDAGGTFKVTHGAIAPDIEAGVGYSSLGAVTHEFGHELSLPDLYGYTGEVGSWDTMCRGNWNNKMNTPAQLTSYSRMAGGWMASQKIRVIPAGIAELLMLDPLEDDIGTIQVIKMDEQSGNYWLVEARRKVGFDAYLPGENVLVLYYDSGAKRLYLKATLSSGQSFRTGSVEVMVVKSDMENWAFQVYVSYKTWSSDMRLTSAAGESNTNWGHKAVASVGKYVYVAWDDGRDGNWEIYFKRSTYWGSIWEADQRLTINTANSWYPSVAASGSFVYVAWQDYRDGNWEIYFKRNRTYGQPGLEFQWYADQRLTSNSYNSFRPSVAVSGNMVYVVWYDNRNGNYEIYFKRSIDNGKTWGPDIRLTSNSALSEHPNVAAVGNKVYVVWQDTRNGNYDIFFKRSTDYGVSWGADTPLTTNTAHQEWPSIAAWGYDVHVVWTDFRYGASNTEIFERRSLASGSSWLTEKRLTSSNYLSSFADVAVFGRSVYIVWQDNRTGKWEVWFKDSPDRGLHWTADRILSATPYDSWWPAIAVGGADWGDVFVAWTDYRTAGNPEIYFKYRW